MRVLIVESRNELAQAWADHLRRDGWEVRIAHDQASAVHVLHAETVQIMLLDLVLAEGAALAVADYAAYRQPDLRVVFLTDTAVFSDGSIFRHCPNACAHLQVATPAGDLAAMVQHYARAA